MGQIFLQNRTFKIKKVVYSIQGNNLYSKGKNKIK
jgi:hypothetical protein